MISGESDNSEYLSGWEGWLAPLSCLNQLLRVWTSIRKFQSDPHFLF
ncbi:MAG: hypothetical protein QOF62_1131 [Pyrinomonadaceae bacterium]|jgi:hypothetical protein|nr:hypothetical protein [Pyrinomonadaceae bacterium]